MSGSHCRSAHAQSAPSQSIKVLSLFFQTTEILTHFARSLLFFAFPFIFLLSVTESHCFFQPLCFYLNNVHIFQLFPLSDLLCWGILLWICWPWTSLDPPDKIFKVFPYSGLNSKGGTLCFRVSQVRKGFKSQWKQLYPLLHITITSVWVSFYYQNISWTTEWILKLTLRKYYRMYI